MENETFKYERKIQNSYSNKYIFPSNVTSVSMQHDIVIILQCRFLFQNLLLFIFSRVPLDIDLIEINQILRKEFTHQVVCDQLGIRVILKFNQ
jgi:hypothetical protein